MRQGPQPCAAPVAWLLERLVGVWGRLAPRADCVPAQPDWAELQGPPQWLIPELPWSVVGLQGQRGAVHKRRDVPAHGAGGPAAAARTAPSAEAALACMGVQRLAILRLGSKRVGPCAIIDRAFPSCAPLASRAPSQMRLLGRRSSSQTPTMQRSTTGTPPRRQVALPGPPQQRGMPRQRHAACSPRMDAARLSTAHSFLPPALCS